MTRAYGMVTSHYLVGQECAYHISFLKTHSDCKSTCQETVKPGLWTLDRGTGLVTTITKTFGPAAS